MLVSSAVHVFGGGLSVEIITYSQSIYHKISKEKKAKGGGDARAATYNT